MGKESRSLQRKEAAIFLAIILTGIIAAYLLSRLSLSTHNEMFTWLSKITGLATVILAVIVPALIQRRKRAGEKEKQATI